MPGCMLDEQCRGASVCEVGASPFHVRDGIDCVGIVGSRSVKTAKSRGRRTAQLTNKSEHTVWESSLSLSLARDCVAMTVSIA